MNRHIRFGAKMRWSMSLATIGIVIDTPNGEQAKVSFTPAAIREMHRICGIYLAKYAEQEAADGVD